MKWQNGLRNDKTIGNKIVKFKNVRLTPNMILNNQPRGVVSASDYYTGSTGIKYYPHWCWGNAGDNAGNGFGWSATRDDSWNEYVFPSEFKNIIVKSIVVKSAVNYPAEYFSQFKIQAVINGKLQDLTGTITATQSEFSEGITIPLFGEDCTAIRIQGIKKSTTRAGLYNCQVFGDCEVSEEYLRSTLNQ